VIVKPHGQLRCGTNYLTRVLRENFAVSVCESDECGWKHGPMHGDPALSYVLVTKDPYSWLVSFRRWEEIHNRSRVPSLATFLQTPVSHRRLGATWGASDPLDAWNRSYGTWIVQTRELGGLVIRYERLLTDFDETLHEVERHLQAVLLHEEFVNVTERVDTWATPRKRPALDLRSYVDSAARATFDDDALQLVRERIDTDLARALGYSII
jgi:hypothetical protein